MFMGKDHKIKAIFTSKLGGTTIVEEEVRENKPEDNVLKNISSTFSVDSFPIAKLEIHPTSKYPNLISIKSGDQIEIFMSEIDSSLDKMFQGIISSVKVKAAKDKFELAVECVSVFYLLQAKKINYQNFKVKTGLREILNELILICGINGKIEIDKNIPNDFTLTPFKSFPPLSFINAICYKLDLVYDFNKGEVMTISKRSDILDRMHNSIPIVITEDQIISSEFNQ